LRALIPYFAALLGRPTDAATTTRIARCAAEYGVVIGGDIGIDIRRVKARADAIVAASRNGLTSAVEKAANITLHRGHARFASPQAVEIRPRSHTIWRLRAGRIFINVGGRALPPREPSSSMGEGWVGVVSPQYNR
jgi:pyruvate/2-oxoglutarate dehydrogenase complex dihydrolipoamide dehydrogenase (E3) component